MTNIDDRSRHWPSNGGLGGGVASSSEKLAKLIKAPPCPRCSAPMWLARIEPHPTPEGGADDMIYECGCGEQFIRTVKTR
jgi:hypothetical protein